MVDRLKPFICSVFKLNGSIESNWILSQEEKHMKRALRIAPIMFIIANIGACREATVVFECAKPTKLEVVQGIDVGGDIAIKNAKTAINVKLGQVLKTEFVSADPDKWISIAGTYQYQICQLINNTRCGDLSELECLNMKKSALNEAFDKINAEFKAEKEKLEVSQKKVSACIEKRTKEVLVKSFSQPGGVRCPGGGCLSGNCNRRETTVEYRVPTNYYISNYRIDQGGTNDGTTGPVNAESDSSNRVIKISAYIACDPADYPGADGGWNNITLSGELSYINPDALIAEIRGICENEAKASM